MGSEVRTTHLEGKPLDNLARRQCRTSHIACASDSSVDLLRSSVDLGSTIQDTTDLWLFNCLRTDRTPERDESWTVQKTALRRRSAFCSRIQLRPGHLRCPSRARSHDRAAQPPRAGHGDEISSSLFSIRYAKHGRIENSM